MPPRRMTANPQQPTRYRAGKPSGLEKPGSDSSSYSESEDSEDEQPREDQRRKTQPPKVATTVFESLKQVNLHNRFQGRGERGKHILEQAASRYTDERVDDGGTSSEAYTTDSEDDSEDENEGEAPRRTLLRPTFIPKKKRIASRVRMATTSTYDHHEGEEREKHEAHELLEERLKREAEAKAAGNKNWDDTEDGISVDDMDGLDPEAERAAWKLRELTRVKRERDALGAIEKEREEIEERRQMDPELREREDLEFVRQQRKEKAETRGKMGFMQKFYHKGAFYQDDSEILKRNYATAATEDSAKNRETLPKYMQVRGDEVGKRGRTKWTHLTAEDTSLQGNGSPWSEQRKRPRLSSPRGT